jgi:hypothetical protein
LRERVGQADAYVHVQDLEETDLLLAADYAAHEGGFAAAQAAVGANRAALYHLDSHDPARPVARPLPEEIARVVRARAAHPGWIAGMMRHGFRGGAELAATLDHLGAFAHLAGAVPAHLFDLYHDATLGDVDVRAFLARENPGALAAMEARFAALHRAGLWQTRRNSILASLPDARRMTPNGTIRGWCPNAWRPMEAGDGLLVRVKPRMARLTAPQARALCEAALRHGNGIIDLTRRANLQLRGVGESQWRPLLESLITLGLVDEDPTLEARRTILVAPDWQVGDDTHRIATALVEALPALPPLPGKIGFVVDAGPAPVLTGEAGDFRIERGASGGLILRAQGRPLGAAAPFGKEAALLADLACWFARSGGAQAGRMARHTAPCPTGPRARKAPRARAHLSNRARPPSAWRWPPRSDRSKPRPCCARSTVRA